MAPGWVAALPATNTYNARMANVARVTVNLPVKVWQEVERMAKEKVTTRTEILRRAISTEVFRDEVERQGNLFLIERPDGSLERVRFGY